MTENASIVKRFLADEPTLLSSLDFGPFVAQGTGSGPSLLIGDTSEISLMQSTPTSHRDHRMAHLAKAGDVVLVRNRDPVFERYLKDYRGLENVTFLGADPTRSEAVAKQAFTSELLLNSLVNVARRNGGLTIHSYLTTETTWHLAQAIGERAACIVHVSGPSARISQRANDKLWFTQLARKVIGDDAVPPTISAYGPKAAAALILRLNAQGQQVIVKVPDSAGSAGNIRLDKAALETLTADQVETLLMDRLHGIGWADSYPILVGVWDADVTSTPSVQMWIPHISDGEPSAQGVFEQRVFGASAAFIGAVKSTLSNALQDALVTQALTIARVLQQLGYYGRCSFDAVICTRNDNANSIHWIECNGRWSGVSILSAVLHSIHTGPPPKGLVILQERLPGDPCTTSDAINAMHKILYRGGPREEGVILMSPPIGVIASTANLLIFAKSQADAIRLGDEAMQMLKTTTPITEKDRFG